MTEPLAAPDAPRGASASATGGLRILLIEDRTDLAEMIGEYLDERGHHVDYASDGVAGLHLAESGQFDVIVLDRLLPRMDGASVCRRLRMESGVGVPVLMLTALDTLNDKLAGLEAGADDYLVKPFELAELEARLLALHRRASGRVATAILRVADLEFDPATQSVHRAGRQILLNPMERKLLEHLMRQTYRVVPRSELEFVLWGRDLPDRDLLRAHIHKLRERIDHGARRKLLHTHRGAGYRIADLG